MKIANPRDFGQVAVVMGGDSSEREVSLRGGRHVVEALQRLDVSVQAIDGVPALLESIQSSQVDRVFNLLHGRGGEDGTLQGLLRCLGVPFTGSGVLGSAVSMNKILSKRVWQQQGLATAEFRPLAPGEDPRAGAEALGYPLVVKPASEGSSVGVGLVKTPAELDDAVAEARRHERTVMMEAFIAGGEYTVGILAGVALPVVRIQPAREFYDYAAKYEDAGTEYHCPAGLSEAEERDLKHIGSTAFTALGCHGWGRVDFLREGTGDFQLLEANTTPGMTSHSLVPKAAAVSGIDFDALVWRILETSFDDEGGA